MGKFNRLLTPSFLLASILWLGCGNQPVKPVDLPDPENNAVFDTSSLENDVDYMEDLGVNSDSDYVEYKDTTSADGLISSDSTSGNSIAPTPPANSSLKTVNAIYKSADCDKVDCELLFETEGEEKISFCGAFGEFVTADFRVTNKELVGKKFMVIYKTESRKSGDDEKAKAKSCNVIIFAKPM
ncbi:MAG: hypothetical protein ACK5C5_07470 [Bacteroidota bacterium]|jgi:hypothetical protein